jgi:5-formyltetrahydrofolate cyclo-ligase
MELKSTIRQFMLQKRNELSDMQVQEYSTAIFNKLIMMSEALSLKVVHVYIALGNEVDLSLFINAMLDNGVKIVTTKSLKGGELKHLVLDNLNDLSDGIYGTKFPTTEVEYKGDPDLILVPGLAFDSSNNRIGYGAGYYDKFLAEKSSARKIGICYDFQVKGQLPIEPHDIKMDFIITN